MAPVTTDYFTAGYCLVMDFHFLIPNMIVPPEDRDIYTDLLNNEFGSGVYSGNLDLNISLRPPNYCNVFQAEVKAICRGAQWILVNGASFTSVSVFSDSQNASRSLSIIRECGRCLYLLSGRFTRVSLV